MGFSHFICSLQQLQAPISKARPWLLTSELSTSEQARQVTSQKSLSQVEGQVKWKLIDETVQVTNLTHLVLCKAEPALSISRVRGTVGHGTICWKQQDTWAAAHPQPKAPAQAWALLSVQPSSGTCELCSKPLVFSQSKARFPSSASRLLLFVCCYQQMGTLAKPQITAASRGEKKTLSQMNCLQNP